MSFLETPFQKSVRLLNAACDNVNDPIVRKVRTLHSLAPATSSMAVR